MKPDTKEARRVAQAVYLATEEGPAKHISGTINALCARVEVLEAAIKFAVSACYCDDRDGNCNPPASPWCDRCKRLSAALEGE